MANNNVSQETIDRVYGWCKSSVGGAWSTLTKDEFQIEPLSESQWAFENEFCIGGLTNFMYLCTLPNYKETKSSEPRSLLIRVYGQLSKSMEFVLSSSVLFSILAERQLGPKLFGVFPEGRIEEFLPARPLKTEELSKPEISKQIAKKLARFHNLKAPLCKKPTWLFTTIEGWLHEAVYNMRYNNRLVLNEKLHKYMSFDLITEFEQLRSLLLSVKSPVLFCHNDLQEGNILYKENSEDPNDSLTFVDLDYCNYNFRAFDFANHMMEWCYDYTYDQPPYFKYTPSKYPSLEEKHRFFQEYLAFESDLKEVSEEEISLLTHETDTFTLASSFFWGVWSVVMAATSEIPFDYVEYAVSRFDHYFTWKSTLAAQCKQTVDE